MVTRWQIWYDDGSTVESSACQPEHAPLDGIMGIVEWHDDLPEPRRLYGQEFYHWTGDSWRAGNIADLERWLRGVMPTVKYGRWAPESMWTRVKKAILDACTTG